MIKQSRELKVGDRFFCPPAGQCFTILRVFNPNSEMNPYSYFIVTTQERFIPFAFEGHESVGVVSQSNPIK